MKNADLSFLKLEQRVWNPESVGVSIEILLTFVRGLEFFIFIIGFYLE